MKVEDCFKIAYVMKTHGLKGEVTIALLPDCPDLTSLTSVFLEVKNHLVPYFIESVSVKGIKAYIKLEEVNTAEGAAALTGSGLFISKDHRPVLSKGEFYNDEVSGFEVTDMNFGAIGHVQGVLETGANRHLIVLFQGREIMIPLNGPFIQSVNKSKKKITVDLPVGFLEI